MSTLELNQIKTLNDFEINLNRAFQNLNIKKTRKMISSFEQKLTILKENKQSFRLYGKLIEINNFVNAKYAEKYLEGFLEFNGVTFNEYLNLNNN